MDAWKVPGCVLVIVRDGPEGDEPERIVWRLGTSDGVNAINDETTFPLTSNTKLFTNLALGRALQDAGFTWDTPLKIMLPEFEAHDLEHTHLWTSRLIASHLSGFPRYDQVTVLGLTAEEMLHKFKLLPSTAKPGEQFQYCNLTYSLFDLLIHRLTNVKYRDYIKQVILDPLGMKNTGFEVTDNVMLGHVPSIDQDGERRMKPVKYYLNACSAWDPAIGLLTTSSDLHSQLPGYARACESIATKNVEYGDYPHEDEYRAYGLGLTQTSYKGVKLHGHTGDGFVNQSLVANVPQLGIRFGMACNAIQLDAGCGFRDWLEATLLDQWSGREYHDWLPDMLAHEKKAHADWIKSYLSYLAKGSHQLLGKYVCPGFLEWDLTSESNLSHRPECSIQPWDHKLYAIQKPVFTSMGNMKFDGCFELTFPDGRKEYATPFKAELADSDAGEGEPMLRVFGLTGQGDGLQEENCPMIFVRQDK